MPVVSRWQARRLASCAVGMGDYVVVSTWTAGGWLVRVDAAFKDVRGLRWAGLRVADDEESRRGRPDRPGEQLLEVEGGGVCVVVVVQDR